MKRLTAVLSMFLTFAFLTTFPAEAQHQQHHRQQGQQGQQGMMARPDSMQGGMMGQGMMQGMMQRMQGMHQQMMQSPMHRARMMTFMLPALADTLGLSEEQVDQLNQLKSEAMSQRQEHQQQMMSRREQFEALFGDDAQPSADAVREHLMAMAEMRAEQQAAMYETAQAMRQVLTAEQRQTLGSLTPQQKMRQMMSRMPMMDMMRMMRSMQGGMMGDGMMQGGMMGQGMMQGGMMGQGMMQGGMMGQGMMQQGDMQNMPRQQNRQNR